MFELNTVAGLPRVRINAIAILDAAAAIVLAWLPLTGLITAVSLFAPLLMGYFLLRGVIALYDKREHPFRNCAWSVFFVVACLCWPSILYTAPFILQLNGWCSLCSL